MVQLDISENDFIHEEEILRNPHSVKSWLRYIEHKQEERDFNALNMVFERALKQLPGSYKLWYKYLRERRRQCKGKPITHVAYEEANNAHERALVFMHKMPRVWIDYGEFLMRQEFVTRTRRTFDRALRALPVTQHVRIWEVYIRFLKRHDIVESAVRCFRRFVKLSPECIEDFINYLVKNERLDEAAKHLADIVNDDNFTSRHGKSKHQLWQELSELIAKHPEQITCLNADAVIRSGFRKFSDQVGQQWCLLADYYIRQALFEKARDVYEEGIQSVKTVRDFTQIFDAYAAFEEELISTSMTGSVDDDDMEMLLARFEDLLERRPFLVNSVLLRQNPHNVHEWMKRAELYKEKPRQCINTFTEALQTVDPLKAVGKLHKLWIAFAKFYEDNEQIDDSRTIFEKAAKVQFRTVDDLAAIWCEYAEMELRQENYDGALRLMKRSTALPQKRANYFDNNEPVQNRVYLSLKLWSMFADLEESFGDFGSTKIVYDRIIDLKIATPQIILNYALFLEENQYFEESFKAYERGVSLFSWPHVFDIWQTYLVKFLSRYGGRKLERARDLFDQCLENMPKEFAKKIILLYAKLEEDHGLVKRAMEIYSASIEKVKEAEQIEMFSIYIRRTAELHGLTACRPVYEQAVNQLNQDGCREMCLRYAELEMKIGEVDRSRAIFAHAANICNPDVHVNFWDKWKDFETEHGNEDTIREMLRVKRQVAATHNTQVNYMAAAMLAQNAEPTGTTADLGDFGDEDDDMAEIRVMEQKAAKKQYKETMAEKAAAATKGGIKFVSSSNQPLVPDSDKKKNEDELAANVDEIALDEDDDEEEEGEAVVNIAKQTIPSAVFGTLDKDNE